MSNREHPNIDTKDIAAQAEAEEIEIFNEENGIMFHSPSGSPWIMELKNGRVRFNRVDYPDMFEDEFATKVGEILEANFRLTK